MVQDGEHIGGSVERSGSENMSVVRWAVSLRLISARTEIDIRMSKKLTKTNTAHKKTGSGNNADNGVSLKQETTGGGEEGQ